MRFTNRITVEVDRVDSASRRRLTRDATVILPACKMHVVYIYIYIYIYEISQTSSSLIDSVIDVKLTRCINLP